MKLTPCPFCGGEADIVTVSSERCRDDYSKKFVIECSCCYSKSREAVKTISLDSNGKVVTINNELDVIIENWNTRVGEVNV